MSKSKSKDFRPIRWDDEEENGHRPNKKNDNRLREKRIRNIIRSNDVNRLMEIDEDDEYVYGRIR
jgi:hypothetical protein